MVGATGFEPAAPCAQGRCATRLRYAPTGSQFTIEIWGDGFPGHSSRGERELGHNL
jgi:hypothetical protein